MNAIAGLPVAVESHRDARTRGGRVIGFRACSRAVPSAQAWCQWSPTSLPDPTSYSFIDLASFPALLSPPSPGSQHPLVSHAHTLLPPRALQPLPPGEASGLVKPSPAYLQTNVAMMTHQAVQQQSASRCSSVFLRRQHSQKE